MNKLLDSGALMTVRDFNSIVTSQDQAGLILAARRGHDGDHVDSATDGVLAVQGPLRASEHLDPIHIGQVHNQAERSREIDPVDVERDAAFRSYAKILLPYAADEYIRGRLADVLRGSKGQVRNEILESSQVGHGARFQIRGGQGDD